MKFLTWFQSVRGSFFRTNKSAILTTLDNQYAFFFLFHCLILITKLEIYEFYYLYNIHIYSQRRKTSKERKFWMQAIQQKFEKILLSNVRVAQKVLGKGRG